MHENGQLDPYGPRAAALLAQEQSRLLALEDDLQRHFYAELMRHARPEDVIKRLVPRDFFTACLYHPLDRLFESDLTASVHEERARTIGARFAFLGIENTWLVAAHEHSLNEITHHIALWPMPETDKAVLQHILSARLLRSLSGQVGGERHVLQNQQRVVAALIRLIETSLSLNDLGQGILTALTSLEGMVAGTLARPDLNGEFQYELVVGKTHKTHGPAFIDRQLLPHIAADRLQGLGPSGRAWRSGQVEQSLFIPSDPTMAVWHGLAEQLGYVSEASIPILDTNNEPQAILNLFHECPGYFATPDRLNLLDRLRAVLSTTLAKFTHGTPTLSYSARADYREYLAHGRLTMLYQPVINLKTGRLQKVEALARLNAPDGSYISPAQFLPALGAHDLRHLFALGLRRALTDIHIWEQQGLATSVAVNLPPDALVDPEYLQITRAILRDIPSDTGRLTLELLEDGEIDQKHNPAKILSEWRALGVRLAQDDLGSGYSSLLRMEQFAVDDVKIDQGLVRSAPQAPRKALQFIHHLTHLVHDLSVQVVVEGLESPGLIEAAAILGADAGQGYAISPPMEAYSVVAWARDFHYKIDPCRPETALGVYATVLLHNALVALVETRPSLLKSIMAEPSSLSLYIKARQLQAGPLGKADAALQSLARKGVHNALYRNALQRVDDLLCQHIRSEESVRADSAILTMSSQCTINPLAPIDPHGTLRRHRKVAPRIHPAKRHH